MNVGVPQYVRVGVPSEYYDEGMIYYIRDRYMAVLFYVYTDVT